MRMLIGAALGAVLCAALAGCVAMTAAHPGAYRAGAIGVDLQHAWTSIPPGLNTLTNGTVLTRHGTSLERVDIMTLSPGQSILKVARNVDAPKYRAGMSETELVEFVTASLTRMGLTDIAPDNVRAFTLAGSPGVRLNVNGRYPSGLNLRGDVAMAEANGKLNIIMFVAPAAHYYEASASEIDHLIGSARVS